MQKIKAYKTRKRYIAKPLAVLLTVVLLCQLLVIGSSAAITVDSATNAGNLIAGGGQHSLALNPDGTLCAWGYNGDCELGDGTSTNRITPVQVSGLTDVVAMGGGFLHSLALEENGTVYAWGYNSYGQLGDGTTTKRKTPVQVSGLTDVVAIAAGSLHSLALKSDGTVWAWGYNNYGQLGDGTTTQSTTPVQVSGLTDVVAIAAGRFQSLALKSDGTVYAWGYNGDGALGDGSSTTRKTPVQVSALIDVVAIAAGSRHSLALKSDGTVYAWGYNSYGQLGDGTTTNRTTPVQVSGLNLSRNYLDNLLMSEGTLSPQFDPDTLSYSLEFPNAVTSIDISPFADSDYQIKVQDTDKESGSTTTLPLYLGENTITIEVTDPTTGFSSHTYTLTATSETTDETNANLYRLETGTGVLSPAFDTNTTEYTVSVNNTVSSIDIIAIPADTSATTTISNQYVGSGEQSFTVSLGAGENVIPIEVHASNGQATKEYTITVTRGLSDNADLSALTVGTGSLDPVFDADTVVYSVQTTDALNSIDITAVTAEAGSAMTIGGQTAQSNTPVTIPLDNGSNLIPIVITAPDGKTQKSYIISVNGTVDNADLKSLSISEGTLNFDAATTEYYVTVGSDATAIDLTASASDDDAVMLLDGAILSQDGTGTIPLDVGDNKIELMVIAQNATTKTYTITVNRGTSDATLSALTLSDGTLSPTFSSTTYTYTATVANSVSSLTVTPKTSDSGATVTVTGNTALSVGSNTVTIKVTGSDGVTTKTYTVTVTRQAEIEITNASLPVSIVDGAYSVTMAAEGGDGSFVWSATGLPSTLSLNSTTGVLSGTPVDGDEGTYSVTITVTDGNGVTGDKSYTLVIHEGCGNGAYLIVSDGDAAYTGSYTDDGIPTLTVNDGVSGFTYFRVYITTVTGHAGDEVCLFVHRRDGEQIGFCFNEADYDTVGKAGAAFNVQAGDVIEVYIVDELTNGAASNPNVL